MLTSILSLRSMSIYHESWYRQNLLWVSFIFFGFWFSLRKPSHVTRRIQPQRKCSFFRKNMNCFLFFDSFKQTAGGHVAAIARSRESAAITPDHDAVHWIVELSSTQFDAKPHICYGKGRVNWRKSNIHTHTNSLCGNKVTCTILHPSISLLETMTKPMNLTQLKCMDNLKSHNYLHLVVFWLKSSWQAK